ncbi:SGNH/GDSL hydrolase family protein [Marinirhabdus gelatinilytica]|uniref:GDSL-like lipase/acylhydrolase family protein n=1 Tax=Marinirhabdus gelatinilytica TaxID=1703343 RepID=A0A370Q3Q3_9FLAO|nr:SGNH/GDSL hydrolase family protein [Marinirhabdus gelatinilytica]RDK82998.1 GDSL-like lipase/acylhydrolase family protein [Marinirhabdus gelatinilytica]
MKKTIYIVLGGLLTLGFVSCEPEFDNPVDEPGFYTTGDADMSNFVAVGNSLTAGFADGALYITGQENSYPNIIAQQAAFADGGEFTQPLMADNLGGLLLNGEQVAQNRFVLPADPATGEPLGPVVLDGTPTTEVTTSETGPFNNMGVPGAKSFHLVTPGYSTLNPYYGRIATSSSATVLADAVSLNPSFFALWIGNNDILSYATSGGIGVDQTGNLDPSTYGNNDITDPNVFASVYNDQVNALMAGASGGVLINIPDVTSIPFFTTVPVQSIPLDAATAAAVNAQFALYNNQVLPLLVGAGVISPEEAALREINFTAGVNFPTITDDDLTDVTNILISQGIDAETAALLGQLRQANNDDLVVLTASSVLGALADPSNPLSVIGVAVPLQDQFVLTGTEQDRVSTATQAYNTTIVTLATANDLAFVDARSALAQVANGGVAYDAGLLTNEFVTGGAFSLDGVHPTPRGYAYTANLIIEEINSKYNATIPTVNIGNYGTITLTNNVSN